MLGSGMEAIWQMVMETCFKFPFLREHHCGLTRAKVKVTRPALDLEGGDLVRALYRTLLGQDRLAKQLRRIC